ncbi:MAG: RNA methyltransferase [Ilumatobacter sp.]|nr:RNA methyltransferase [Ilumatobacter sp.]
MTVIDDLDDERFGQFRVKERSLASRAQKRDDAGAGLFLAEGDLVVERAFAAGCVPTAALVDVDRVPDVAHRLGCPVYGGGPRVRSVVQQLGLPLTILALFERPPRPTVAELGATAHRLVVVEAVDNPVNIGAIVRNAAALGWDGLVLDHTSADPLARRSLRVAMGTAFSLPHARTRHLAADLGALAGIDLYALTPDRTATPLADVAPAGRAAVLVGSERAGLSAELLAISTPVTIPMAAGVDSLNAASATAIACWALRPES